MFKYKFFHENSRNNSITSVDGLTIIPAPSPYFSNETITPVFIILHCIGYNNPLEVLAANQVSCHYLIPEQNNSNALIVYEVVKPPLRAWHAGISQWQDYKELNNYSIGIEINMPNYAHALENRSLDYLYFENFQSQQIAALTILVKKIQLTYSIPAENIIGHADVAAWRNTSGVVALAKTDPGPTLAWEALAQDNIGVWPTESCPDTIKNNLTVFQLQNLLSEVGYYVPHTGRYDLPTNLTMGAARLHWASDDCFNISSGSADQCYTNPFDAELACALYNLAQSNDTKASTSKSFMLLTILLSVGSPLLVILLALILYKSCVTRNNQQNAQARSEHCPVRNAMFKTADQSISNREQLLQAEDVSTQRPKF